MNDLGAGQQDEVNPRPKIIVCRHQDNRLVRLARDMNHINQNHRVDHLLLGPVENVRGFYRTALSWTHMGSEEWFQSGHST
ncbi:MAG: hypothetical protein F4Z65_13070 [Acidobacteria bacterium]|nr:hypothetical protein [Acidobacteriota bacterium]MYA47431.1 hypothetical protein [Acidobacteriota bacterium]MYI39801.1 hypothetical protein [Acidobacteriota bacterium]